jgi:methionyl-tRNA formyltransferase
MGTPDFALPAFNALVYDPFERFDVCLVLSKPDAPTGRGLKMRPSVISSAAAAAGIELHHPDKLDGYQYQTVLDRITEMNIDIAVVTAYGMLLTEELINAPRLGTVNIHGSLLPRWRGAAPVERAILAGDEHTGVTVQQVRPELDSGPIYSSATTRIEQKSYTELLAELALLGAGLLADSLPGIAAGTLSAMEQNESLVTYAAKLSSNELALDPAVSAVHNTRRTQAASRRFPARLNIAGRSAQVLRALPATAADLPVMTGTAGDIMSTITTDGARIVGNLRLHNNRLFAGTIDGWLEIIELVPDGKRPMKVTDFLRGLRVLPGDPEFIWTKWN